MHEADASDELLTTQQAADALNLTTSAVQKAIARGRIEARQYGRDYLVRRAEVERYRLTHRRGGRPRRPDR